MAEGSEQDREREIGRSSRRSHGEAGDENEACFLRVKPVTPDTVEVVEFLLPGKTPESLGARTAQSSAANRELASRHPRLE